MTKTIGQRISKARHEKKMSQLKLSQLTNYSQAILSAYENDNVVPSERALRIIAQVLEVKVSTLRYGEESGTDDDVTELGRKFNILINHLKIPPEIFHYNKKEKSSSTFPTKRGRPKKIKK